MHEARHTHVLDHPSQPPLEAVLHSGNFEPQTSRTQSCTCWMLCWGVMCATFCSSAARADLAEGGRLLNTHLLVSKCTQYPRIAPPGIAGISNSNCTCHIRIIYFIFSPACCSENCSSFRALTNFNTGSYFVVLFVALLNASLLKRGMRCRVQVILPLYCWLQPEAEDKVPRFATHQVGCAGWVTNARGELLTERAGMRGTQFLDARKFEQG